MYLVPVTSRHHHAINIGQEQVTACHCLSLALHENCLWWIKHNRINNCRSMNKACSHNLYIYCPKCFNEMQLSCWTTAKSKSAIKMYNQKNFFPRKSQHCSLPSILLFFHTAVLLWKPHHSRNLSNGPWYWPFFLSLFLFLTSSHSHVFSE